MFASGFSSVRAPAAHLSFSDQDVFGSDPGAGGPDLANNSTVSNLKSEISNLRTLRLRNTFSLRFHCAALRFFARPTVPTVSSLQSPASSSSLKKQNRAATAVAIG